MVDETLRILLLVKGHPYDRNAFYGLFEAMEGVEYTVVEQPAAQILCNPEYAADYDALVFYDMPGIEFDRSGTGRGPTFIEPTAEYKAGLLRLVEQGHGFVFLHHAIAGWPAWEGYAELMGGRFLYLPGMLQGTARLDSGYRHQVDHNVRVLADHPITSGVPRSFPMTDELYLYEVFDDAVSPLLASDHTFTREHFYSAAKVVREGKMFDNSDWPHAPGSNLVGWTRAQGASRIAYIQGGDDPVAYANPHYQQLVHNAIIWASDAHQ